MNPSSYSSSETDQFAMQLVVASVLPRTLAAAIELDLLELIKKAGSASAAELAAQIRATNPDADIMIDRILRLLAANNILECKVNAGVDRSYSLAPVCELFTRNDAGVSFAPLLLVNEDRVLSKTFYHLKDAVVEGGVPFDRAHGVGMFEYPATDPKFNKMFNRAMYEQSTLFMHEILEIYDGFEGVESLVDVGGGIGASLKMILRKYPSIKAINFDLPHVIERAPSHQGVIGVEQISGDMFVSVPRGDVIFMKWICHDWSDSHCSKLLKNCYEALPHEGKVVIAERILPEVPNKEPLPFAVDLLMLAYGTGKERTESEFHALANAAGFTRFRRVCSAFSVSIMELHK